MIMVSVILCIRPSVSRLSEHELEKHLFNPKKLQTFIESSYCKIIIIIKTKSIDNVGKNITLSGDR